MIVSIKKAGIEDLEVHGAVTKFEVHVHTMQLYNSGPSGNLFMGDHTVVSLLKCDGEWLHITSVEKLLVEET
jgi:hypothetical protein